MERKPSKNLWNGKFKEKELILYDNLNDRDIKIIIDYQKLLPILQEDNEEMINTRDLHFQLKLSRQYDKWIKNISEQLDLQEGKDLKSLKTISKNQNDGRPKIDYYVAIETAKEIAMIAGIGNRVNEETKSISKISRKYFIAIEKAFKSRYSWNKDRQASIDAYYDLRETIFEDFYDKNVLSAFVPKWWNIEIANTGKKNTYAYELYLLDLVIIGMSAQEYRKINNIRKGIAIRNTFTEEQLEDFELLQSKSAEYLVVNKIWNTNDRLEMLKKFYEYYKENKGKKIS